MNELFEMVKATTDASMASFKAGFDEGLKAGRRESVSTLQKAIDTFDDLQRVLRLLGRPTLADACAVAADGTRDVLAKVQS